MSTNISSSSNLIPLDGLPPILTSTGVKGGTRARPDLRFPVEESGMATDLLSAVPIPALYQGLHFIRLDVFI